MSDFTFIVTDGTPVPVYVAGASDVAGGIGPQGPAGAGIAEVANRTALAAVTPSDGAVRYLAEDGREGFFKFDNSNLSAKVAADTYQALYVAPSSMSNGNDGAWVRTNTLPGGDLECHLTWWGVTEATPDAYLHMTNALAIIPDGGMLVLPPYQIEITQKVLCLRSNINVRGYGYISHIHTANQIDMLQFRVGSHIRCDNFRMSGNVTSNPGNPACLFIGSGGSDNELVQCEDFEFSNLWLEDTSLGIVCAATNDADELLRTRNIRIHHCTISSDVQGISLFGAEQVHVHDNMMFCPSPPVNNFVAYFRVIGSKNVIMSNNICNGDPIHAVFGGYMNRNGYFAIPSEDVFITDNQFHGVVGEAVYFATGVHGSLVVQDNEFITDPSNSTRTESAFDLGEAELFPGQPTNWGGGWVTIKDNKFVGFFGLVVAQYTPSIKHMLVKGNTLICNSTVSGDVTGHMFKSQFGGPRCLDIIGNEMLQAPGSVCDSSDQACIINISDGMIIRAFGNHLPEGCTTAVGAAGTGTVEQLDNYTYPSGSWAAAT